MRAVLSFLHERAVYAWISFAVPPISLFAHALAPGQAVLKGQGLGILSALALTAVAVLAWIPFHRRSRPGRWGSAFLILALVTWGAQVVRIQWDQSLFTIAAGCTPVILGMLLLKPPDRRDLGISALTLGYGLVAIGALSIVLGAAGLMPNGFDGADSASCRTPILCDLTGGLDRWAGPFGSVNYAAPVGGLIVVFGASQPRRHAVPLIIGGAAILLLSQGRSAMFAVVAGLAVLVLWGARVSAARTAVWWRSAGVLLLAACAGAYVWLLDPTLNGRVGIWSQFLSLWRESPLTGIGDSGVQGYVEGRPGLLTFTHAHSVVLDHLVRWGVAFAVLSIALLALGVVVSSKGLRTVGPGPTAVAVFIAVAGLVETIHGWVYWTAYLAMLCWAVLISVSSSATATDHTSVQQPRSVSLS